MKNVVILINNKRYSDIDKIRKMNRELAFEAEAFIERYVVTKGFGLVLECSLCELGYNIKPVIILTSRKYKGHRVTVNCNF